MSKVATGRRRALLDSPAKIQTGVWRLQIVGGTLGGRLNSFDVQLQLPISNDPTMNLLFGNAESTDHTVFGLVDGLTEVVEQVQQVVAFDLVMGGMRYHFDGALSADGNSIIGGTIEKHRIIPGIPARGQQGSPITDVDDGTWSAQAPTGPPPEEQGKGKVRRRHRH